MPIVDIRKFTEFWNRQKAKNLSDQHIGDYAFRLDTYDFETKSFPIKECGNDGFIATTKQYIEIRIHYSNRDHYDRYAREDLSSDLSSNKLIIEDNREEKGLC